MTVLVKRVGGSLAVVIPSDVAREAGLKEGTPLDVSATDTGVVLRKRGRRPRRKLSQIVAKIDPATYARRNTELMRDPPVGREVG